MTLPEPPIGPSYLIYYSDQCGTVDPVQRTIHDVEFSKTNNLRIGDTITISMIVTYDTSDSTGTHSETVTHHFSHTISEEDFTESPMSAEMTLRSTDNLVWVTFVLSSANMC